MRGRNKNPENAKVTRAQRRATLLDHQKQNEVDQPMQVPAANAQPEIRQEGKQQRRDILIRCDAPEDVFPRWFLEITFLEWNDQTFSVYVHRGNHGYPSSNAIRKLATCPGPLTARCVWHFIRTEKSLAIGASYRDRVQTTGLSERQANVIVATLARIGEKTRRQKVDDPENALYWRTARDGGLVYADPQTARAVAQTHRAIETSTTWGEFQSRMPADEWQDIWEGIQDYLLECWREQNPEAEDDPDEIPPPHPWSPFDGNDVPGYADGDYPQWLQQSLETYLPDEVLGKIAKPVCTILNGNYWRIRPSAKTELLRILREHGYEPIHRPDLKFW